MSAYIVSRKTIDAIVTVALRGPRGHRGYAQGWTNQVGYAIYDGIKGEAGVTVTPDELGRALWVANVKSVNYRYQERNAAHMKVAREYVYEPVTNVPTVLEALALLGTYEYQSCEALRWRNSAECRFIERLRSTLLYWIPGYSDAYWKEAE